MNDAIAAIGVIGLFIVSITAGIVLYHTELVYDTTFEAGIVRIDDETAYRCYPTPETVEIRKLKKQMEMIKAPKKKVTGKD